MQLIDIYNNLPNEICDYIQDLHYSIYHNKLMKSNLSELEIKGLLITLNRCQYVDEDNTTRNERINYVKTLSKCKCCDKHFNNRPTFLQYLNGYIPNFDTKPHWYYECKCNCKYYINAFCWIDNDEIIDVTINNNELKRNRSYTCLF
jgi:hypothetical protein